MIDSTKNWIDKFKDDDETLNEEEKKALET